MDNATDPLETPEAFLRALGDRLKGKEGVDADLTDILRTHILKAAPAQNAIAQAKECNRVRFQRPLNLKKPVCAHGGCEAQFEFAAAPAATNYGGAT